MEIGIQIGCNVSFKEHLLNYWKIGDNSFHSFQQNVSRLYVCCCHLYLVGLLRQIKKTHAVLKWPPQLQRGIALRRGVALVLLWWRNDSTTEATEALRSAEAERCKTTHFWSSLWQTRCLCSAYPVSLGLGSSSSTLLTIMKSRGACVLRSH